MEVMFHFAFELVKITLLSMAYAGLLVLFLKLFRRKAIQLGTWLKAVAVLWACLFVYMFTYWGDHGLGDTFRVPIGKGKMIESINAMEYAWIMDVTNSSGERVQMSRFVIADGKVLGNCDDDFYDEPCAYFVYEIDNGGLLEFRDPLSFAQECDRQGWPGPELMVDFGTNYHRYWDGWRFWLLP